MKKTELLKTQAWTTYLNRLFSEHIPYLDCSLGIHLSFNQIIKGKWFKNNNILLGFFPEDSGVNPKRPSFMAIHVVEGLPNVIVNWEFRMEKYKNDLTFIKALANPCLLPACLSFGWTTDFLSSYFSNPS